MYSCGQRACIYIYRRHLTRASEPPRATGRNYSAVECSVVSSRCHLRDCCIYARVERGLVNDSWPPYRQTSCVGLLRFENFS